MIIRNILKKANYAFSSFKNHYQTLKVSSTASEEQIKASYYKLAKMYHPDINASNSERFKQISEAYNILKDPQKRREFDFTINPNNHQHININQHFKDNRRGFRPSMKYSHLDPSSFASHFKKHPHFSRQELRYNYQRGQGIQNSPSYILFLSVMALFGGILAIEMIVTFYKISAIQRQQYYEPDLFEQEDDDF